MAKENIDYTLKFKAEVDASAVEPAVNKMTELLRKSLGKTQWIELDAHTGKAREKIEKFKQLIRGINQAGVYNKIQIDANTTKAVSKINSLKSVISAFGRNNKIEIDAKADKVYDRLNGIVKLMRQMQFTGNRAIKVEANAQKAIDTLKVLKKEYGEVGKQIKITASISGATEVINNLKAIQSLLKKIQKDSNINVKAKIDTSSVQRQVEKATAQTKVQTDNIGTDEAKINRQRQTAIEDDARITRQLEKEREAALRYEQRVRYALGKKGLSGGLSVVDKEDINNVQKIQQTLVSATSTMAQLRAEALRAGNALNKAVNPQEIEKANVEFTKAIQNLVNYKRARSGLTARGEGQLVEKLAIGNIKEGTRAYQVLEEWIKRCEQAQKNLNQTVGRARLAENVKDNTLTDWFRNMDIGRAVAGTAYAARGELNTIQAFGNLLSSLSKVNGVVSVLAKGLGVLTLAGLAVFGVIRSVESAFSSLVNILGQVANTIYNVLRPGIELYKTRQTAELAIAAAISSRATENGKEIPFERAMSISSDMMKRVIADAAMSAFNPQELIDALRGTLPLALGKGWNLEQAYDVTKGVASVAKVINLAPNQVLQELRDILQGTISARSSQVAGATGMTSEELREAEQQGRLYEYIQEHLAKFTVALERYSTTLAGALDRLEETWALGMESIFQRIAPVANNLINEFIDNFIGVYKDKEGNILRNPSDFYTVDEETGEKKYKEAGFEWSEYLNSFGDALVDLVKFIAPIVDEILDFLQQLTGKEEVVSAVTSAIKYMIRVTVTLGEIIASVAKATLVVLDVLEAPISWVLGLLVNLAKAVYHFGEMCVNLGVAIGDMILIIKKALTPGETVTLKDIENSAKLGDKVADSVAKMGNDLKDAFSTTTYDELFGIDKLQKKGGVVTDIVNKALNKSNDDNKEHVDWKQILGQAKEDNKNSIADQRKMIQAMIEDIKQALKQALAELKDIAEQNELAYQQGYKSIEDYFNQKALLEAEEARLKLEAAIAERDAIASLDTGGDASAEYQKQRDLIRYNSDIATYTREYGKKVDQTNELLVQIDRTLNNKTFQRGVVTATGSAVGDKVVQEAIDRLGMPTAYGGDGVYSVDCSSLNMVVNGEAGIEIPRTADEQKRQHDEQQTFHDLQEVLDGMYIPKPGDSVYFRAGDTEGSYDSIGHVEIVKAFRDGILETISGGNYGAGVLEKERELGDYEMAGFGSVAELAQKLGVLNTDAQEATESINQNEGQMPQTYSKLAMEYNKVVKEGQKQLFDAQREYVEMLNIPELLEEVNLAQVEATMKEKIAIAQKRFASIPALADNLSKLYPIKRLDAIVKSAEQSINTRLKLIERDAKAMNQSLREKTMLFPQAIRKYASAFFGDSGDYGLGTQIERLADTFTEYSKLGLVGKAQDVMSKIDSLQDKFVSMVNSWINEMSEYMNYRRSLIDANSGLTDFVKEERRKQIDKGEARVKAVAYAEQAVYWAEQEAGWQKKLNEYIEQGGVAEGSVYQQRMQSAEQYKQMAMRQAEINSLLGEQKTLWQETMDAANQALENGLYQFMTDYINTAESIGEAFRNMAVDILKDLQKFFAKKAITDLMHAIVGEPNVQYNAPNQAEMQTSVNTGQMIVWLQNIYNAISALQTSQTSSVFTNIGGTVIGSSTGGTNSIANRILHHATGGYISGKGTSTSDSIPAMLSNGEYVIKAESVRKYGTNFLNAVNNGAFTRMKTHIPHFADGGYVGDALQDTARGMTDFARSIGTNVSTNNDISIALVRDEQEAIKAWAKSPSGGQKFLVDFAKGNGRVFSRFGI